MKEIDIYSYLDSKINDEGDIPYSSAVLAIQQVVKDILELAAKNAKVSIEDLSDKNWPIITSDSYKGNNRLIQVNKQSILNTINQLKT